MTDLIIKNARLATHKTLVNILITDQHIARIEEIADDNANSQDSRSNPAAASYDAQGNFVCGGFYTRSLAGGNAGSVGTSRDSHNGNCWISGLRIPTSTDERCIAP